MNNFFNFNSPIISFLNKCVDLIILNIIWIIFCIPIFTIGPATVALYYTVVKVIRRDRNSIYESFWFSFKSNFKQSIGGWLIMLIIGAFLATNLFSIISVIQVSTTVRLLYKIFFTMLLIVFMSISVYVFPVISRFSLSTKEVLRFSTIISIKYFYFSIAMVVIAAVFIIVSLYYFPLTIWFAFSLYTLFKSMVVERIFKEIILNNKAADGNEKPTPIDEWYLE